MAALEHARKAGGKFLNPVPTVVGGFSTILKVLPLYFRSREETEPKSPVGPFVTDPASYLIAPASGLRVTWFGHSSSLLEIDGVRVLIDPVWDERASPVPWFGPRRFFAPTIALNELPRIDVVLISHDHYDHFGSETVKQLARLEATAQSQWVTSLGVGKRLKKRGVHPAQITELDWTESADLGELKVTAWPARHFSGRGVLDRFRTLWSSFVLETTEHRVYFGADTGWWDGFSEIAAKYDRFDLTMLEIGAFHPLWKSIHLGPDGAAEAYAAMGRATKMGLLMPIHWGLFNLALHGWRQPMQRMLEIAAEMGIPLWSPLPGAPTEVAGQELVADWWQQR